MTSSIPFSITPDAEEFIRDCIAGIPRQAKPTLRRSTFQSDGLKRPRWYYKGESLVIGYFNSDERDQRGFVEFQLFGRSVAVESEALKYLSGRVLGLRRVDSHIGLFNIPRYVLVAGPAEAPARQGRGSERITSDLSITALTILGGFTGTGVAWIVYGIIGAVFKIPVDRLFALKLVWAVFITGWILGAIVSFFFFRSVFKAPGRSRYSRDPKQSNYRVRGDARANLDWWIFLGVPAPLVALTIFALGRLALTVGQKVYGSLVVSMVILGGTMYFCDRIPRRLLFWLGIFGWLLALIIGNWFFKFHGP